MGQGARWVPGPGHVEVPTRGCAPVAGRSLPAPPRADATGGTSRFVAVVKARPRPLVSSALARTEVLRALLGEGPEATGRAHALLGRIDLLRISDRVLGLPGALRPPSSLAGGHPPRQRAPARHRPRVPRQRRPAPARRGALSRYHHRQSEVGNPPSPVGCGCAFRRRDRARCGCRAGASLCVRFTAPGGVQSGACRGGSPQGIGDTLL